MAATTVEAAPETTPATPAPAGIKLFNSMFLKCTFSSTIWEGRRAIAEIVATMGGHEIDRSRVGKPPASICPDALRKQADRARALFYRALSRVPQCDARGTRLVPAANKEALREFVVALNEAVANFDQVAENIASQHDFIVQYNRDYWWPRCHVYTDGGDAEAAYLAALARHKKLLTHKDGKAKAGTARRAAFDARSAASQEEVRRLREALDGLVDEVATEHRYQKLIGHLIPGPDDLRTRFGARYALTSPDDLAGRYEEPVLREFYETAIANAHREAEDTVAAMIEDSLDGLADKLTVLKEKIAGNERLTPASFTEAQDALNVCFSCADAFSPRTRETVAEVREAVQRALAAAETVRQTGVTSTDAVRGAAGQLTALFDKAIEVASDKVGQAEMLARFGVKARRIRDTE